MESKIPNAKRDIKIIIIAIVILIGICFVVTIVFQKYSLLSKLSLSSNKNSNQELTSPQSAQNENTTTSSDESSMIKIIEHSLASVVTIGIKKTTLTSDTLQFDPSNPFSPFKKIPGKKNNIQADIGSGFIISTDGLIITNRHVVEDTSATYEVILMKGIEEKRYPVKQIYRDKLNDLSILKIDAENLTPFALGNSNNLKLGQTAIAIGTPLGEFRNTVTRGIISGLGRGITTGSPYEGSVEQLDGVIQTDAAISHGNSGGPLINSNGQVIGVNTAIASEGQNLGFAIPVNVVKKLIDSFQKRGSSFTTPYIGIQYKMIDKQNGLMNDVVEGVYIKEVIQKSPADQAGIQKEDIITEFNGKMINGSSNSGFTELLLEKKAGDTVQIKVWRNGEVKNLSLTLGSAK
ncbi:MAG: trypsin-like peptidase domain-containing protein [Candidatus Roizmanbacteria bacterium]